MKQFVCIVLLLLGIGTIQSQAQFYPTQYRPPNLNWQQLTTPHFNIVFPQGEDSAAWNTGYILEDNYSKIRDLTGGSLYNFPVVLTNYNDRSNGFVTPLHFRSEIDLAPIKGKAINPRSGTWLNAVVPHELVHAMQFNNLGGFGITRMVSLLSPDLARSLHGAVPLGVMEGLAVHYETEFVTPSGGRGSYPYFTNQFNAVFDSPHQWSMGEMVQISSYSRPFDRHYIGGFEWTSWLQQHYGSNTSREAIRFYADYPFLGYGVALRHATGKWPGQLYDEFEKDKREKINARNNTSFTDIDPLPVALKGAAIRSPKWLSDSTLVFYGSFYNGRAGFYRYDLNSHNYSRLATTGVVQDFKYDLSADKSRLVYSYYESSPIYTNTYNAELVELDISDKTTRQLTRGGRLYAPVFAGTHYLSLQTFHTSSRLVEFDPAGDPKVTPMASIPGVSIVEVAAHPVNSERLAVIANRQGIQALWLGTTTTIENKLRQSPDVSFTGGSVFDPEWHPEGNRLIFTSDFMDTLNVYEYDIEGSTVHQLTRSRYNAFEASYSPQGNDIAFVIQEENEHLPAVLSRKKFYNYQIPDTIWKPSVQLDQPDPVKAAGHDNDISDEQWQTSSYSSGTSWLKPRVVLPELEEVSNRNIYKVGASFHSNDLLQQQSYSTSFSFLQNRLWYNFTYKNTSFFPGFETSVYSKPSFVNLPFDVTVDTVRKTMLRQERSLSMAIPLNYMLERNVFFSSVFLRPNIRQSQIRFFELDHSGSAASDFADVTIANIYGLFSYRLQQNIRDVQPNSGFLLFSEFEHYLWPTDLTIRTLNSDHRRSFVNSYGLRGGIFAYFSPLRKWNQSLRLDVRALNQSTSLFDNQFLISDGFSEPVFPFSRNLLSFGMRYTIPLIYPDNGGFLVPAYLSNIYLVAFTNTVGRFTQPDFLQTSRSVLGAGIRVRFRISNLALDMGVGFGFEPKTGNTNVFIGDF